MKKAIIFVMITMFIISTLFMGCGANTAATDSKQQGNSEVTTSSEDETKENSLEQIKENGKFVVGLDDSFPPMGFRSEEGEIIGFDIDLAKEVAKKMGIEVEFKPVDWDGVIMSLNNKDIDVIWNAFTLDEERKKKVGYTKPYLENKQIIIVPKDSKIQNKQDLKDKIVGLQMGSTSDIALNNEKEVAESLKDIKKYQDNVAALLDLKLGRTDAVVVDGVLGSYYVSQNSGIYKILDDDFGTENYVVACRKGDTSFIEKLDETLDEIKNDGTADEISKKWFGKVIVVK